MTRHFIFPEGATPIADASNLIPQWVHHMDDLNRVEAQNIAHAHQQYIQRTVQIPAKWFTISTLRKIHKAMFDEVWTWAGTYRKSVTSIGIRPELIPAQLANFCYEVVAWETHPVELTFIERAARIHHRLVAIHPFENGNGRFSRLIADRYLISWRCTLPKWPTNLGQNGASRLEYIHALQNADNGNYSELIQLMKRLGACDPSLHDILNQAFYKNQMSREQYISLSKAFI